MASKTNFIVANVRSEGTSGQQMPAGTAPNKPRDMVFLSILLTLSKTIAKDKINSIAFNMILLNRR